MEIGQIETTIICGCRTTMIYCRPGCFAGRRVKSEHRVFFRSTEEARENGYRACQLCKPGALSVSPVTYFLTSYRSPVGPYILVRSELGVVCLATQREAVAQIARWKREGVEVCEGGKHNDDLAGQLNEYFAGSLRQFTVPLDLRGTPFQCQVWELLRSIPYGETREYGQIARALGRPAAARAVGGAAGSNPVAIVVPCHRVIGSNGRLTGYAGGLDRKRFLLDLEAAAAGKDTVWRL